MHIGMAPRGLDLGEIASRKADGGIGQRQTKHAFLRARGPADDARILINREIRDAQGRHRIDQPQNAMPLAGIRKGADVVDPARPGFPMRHESPFRFLIRQHWLDHIGADRLPMRHHDHGHALRLWIHRIGAQLFAGCGLHPDGQRVKAAESAIHENHHAIARQNRIQHAIKARKAGAADAVGMNVLRPPDRAQHLLALDHAAKHRGMHVVGQPGIGETRQHARIGIARPRPRGQRLGYLQRCKERLVGHFEVPGWRRLGKICSGQKSPHGFFPQPALLLLSGIH